MDNTLSETVAANAERIAELVTAICDGMLETSSILPKLVQAIDSLEALLAMISQFEIANKRYRLHLDITHGVASKSHISLYIDNRGSGIYVGIPCRNQNTGAYWKEIKAQVSEENPDPDSVTCVVLTAEAIAIHIDEIIRWLESVLEDVNRRNSALLDYIDTMHRVLSDPEVSKLLVLSATSRRE